ncbi:Ctr copper transporter family-domain-containing protein [Kockovaella imperatae]|uniref:Copper transport protein n=1 Tax=Kockovaella imperatae TaxID=4999 RepID=A0A1Y1UV61_9TREE|nr:Ctr copper transporter family-domain-containing protein [Kockovaella imperatae]ORX41105.1 Ctr copper transporter family-domain-containing protein [Kockovaella imperatae]
MALPIQNLMDMGSMDHGSSSSMNDSSASSMSMSMGDGCKISMLWNWYTVDTCFLSATWHNKTRAMFAGSVIGVFFLTIAIEFVRRLGREFDRRLVAAARVRASLGQSTSAPNSEDNLNKNLGSAEGTSFVYTPTWGHQVLRGLLYGSQFAAAFLVMLLGMYYNGYMLFAIFLGQTTGYIIFGRDTCTCTIDHVTTGHCC